VIRALPLLVVALLAAGCGGGESDGGLTTSEVFAPIAVYFLRDERVWPVARDVEATDDAARAALEELEAGPTGDEEDELGAESALEEGSLDLDSLTVDGSIAKLSSSGDLSAEAEAQVVYTLTHDPSITTVELDGAILTRGMYEQETPSVLVESPLPFGEVSSPLRAKGTANTFEATFSFEILDSSGEVIASDFATATSGSGTRGTFRFDQPFVVDEDQEGTLVVFELSAEDGSRVHEVEVPLELRK
jgi:hypothetical protein